jgi:hypothetical protein
MARRPKAALPAAAAEALVPAKPYADMSKAERMSHNADLALDFTRQLLELPFDPENLKLIAHQKDAALTIISQAIRIEAEQLRGPNPRIEEERNRILAELSARSLGDGADRGKQR